MTDYKMQAAAEAVKLIKQGQTIGLGAGTTIMHLVKMISADVVLAASLTLASSSFKTTGLLLAAGLNVKPPGYLTRLDIYFDGCDQFDAGLNALKSGGGIHTTEKILAAMADEFILLGDAQKYVDRLDTTYPLVIEVVPQAMQFVRARLKVIFPGSVITQRMSTEKDGAVISDNGNYLLNVQLAEIDDLKRLNSDVKSIPGVVEHSLFYQLAARAIIAGPQGITIIHPSKNK